MHYLLFYEKAPDHAERTEPIRVVHLAHVQAAARRGELILAGSFTNPDDGAALLFRVDSLAIVEEFAKGDPYVRDGVVSRWWVRAWDTVVGAEAVRRLPEVAHESR